MNNLRELELILDNLDFLASTFEAIDMANQTETYTLPRYALSVPTETLKRYTKRAKALWLGAWDEAKNFRQVK